MSVLQVDTIQDSAGTTNKELAQYSSGNWSWGSGVPTGTIIACKQWTDTSGDTTVNSNSLTALHESSASQNSFSATSGNSYMIDITHNIRIGSDGDNSINRIGNAALVIGTSAVADEATSFGGNTTYFTDYQLGRILISANTATANSYVSQSFTFIFTASSTATYYFNLCGSAGTVRNMIMPKSTNIPLVTRYFEIQGDVTA